MLLYYSFSIIFRKLSTFQENVLTVSSTKFSRYEEWILFIFPISSAVSWCSSFKKRVPVTSIGRIQRFIFLILTTIRSTCHNLLNSDTFLTNSQQTFLQQICAPVPSMTTSAKCNNHAANCISKCNIGNPECSRSTSDPQYPSHLTNTIDTSHGPRSPRRISRQADIATAKC